MASRTDFQRLFNKYQSEGVPNVRPFTVNRKNSLFYISEEGVDVAATYLTVIETAKMHRLEVRDYLTHVFMMFYKIISFIKK